MGRFLPIHLTHLFRVGLLLVGATSTAFLAPAQIVTPAAVQYGPSSFVNFETPHVHPLDTTTDGQYLLAVNTAEGSLMGYAINGDSLTQVGTVMVGVDPVTVRVRNADEAWVINRVSNNISFIDLNAQVVSGTMDVCHEPGDVVFAGSPVMAVVSCTRPNKLVVINPVTRTIVSSVSIAGESPRALTTSSDGTTVYAAIFESGTPTTILVGDTNDSRINNVTQYAGGPWAGISPVPNNGKVFNPPMNTGNPPPPPVSTIVYKTGDGYFNGSAACTTAVFGSPVASQARSCWQQDPVALTWTVCAAEGGTCKFTGRRHVIFGAGSYTSSGRWQDDINGDWTSIVTGQLSYISNRVTNWDLPDRDVAVFNVASGQVTYQTRLMNAVMAISVNPSNNQVYVVGTDATNSIRFQPILDGVFLRVNLAHFVPGQAPTIVDLNPQLTYKTSSVAVAIRNQSIGDPRAIAWSSSGHGFVTGMGSNSLIEIDATGARLATATVGQGPTGLIVDDARGQLYVMNKFDGSISVVSSSSLSTLSTMPFFDPTPTSIRAGRPFFYNTHTGSGNGQIACGSCHIDGKTDRLAWDLGDPSGDMVIRGFAFHPMKGPMVTQTLQNMIGAPSLHHRGDRSDIFDFAPTFQQLQGAAAPLDTPSMTLLQTFLATLAFPPNPNRNADNTFSTAVGLPGPLGTVRAFADANAGIQDFNNNNCNICHQGSMGRADTQGPNALHVSQNMSPETMQGLYQRLGLFWGSTTGSTAGTGLRTNGAHDSTFANESTTNPDIAYMLSFEGPLDGVVQRTANAHPGIGLEISLTAAGATQQSGTFCANTGGTCSFSGTREVIYGVNGLYISGVFTGSAPCSTSAFGGDPAPGQTKTCAVRAAPLTVCAADGGVCAFTPLSEVFYSSGHGPASSLVLRNNVQCSASVFTGIAQSSSNSCYIRAASEFAEVNYMQSIADTGKVGLVATGFVNGQYRGGYYIGGGQFQTDIVTDTAAISDLYSAVSGGGSQVQLMLVPRGTEYRIGVDANLDGRLNTDQATAGQNPRAVSAGAWQTCAAQSGACTFSGLKVVRFGVPGQYAYGVFENGVSCNTTVFGDPALGATKSCSIAN